MSSLLPYQRIDQLRAKSGELSMLRLTAYLNFLSIDCREVNLLLEQRISDLADRLAHFLVDRNRDLNRE